MITREQALKIVTAHIKNKNLVKHCFAVEAAMKGLAKHFGENELKWSLVGLMHDADWEETTNDYSQHAGKTVEWLKRAGENNQEVIDAILSHNYQHAGFREPQTKMEWSLYCSDDLTGLIVASALVLPDKKLSSLTAKSVLNKFPAKRFAAGVNREQIKLCEEKLAIKLEDFISLVLKSMQEISNGLEL